MYTPGRALEQLKEGNTRFAGEKMQFPNISAKRRAETAGGQKPFAGILTCADSRTAPELIFDQGIGDLFVARVAGNICDDTIIGSFEISVEHFSTSLIVVMGHQSCGAISMAIGGEADSPNTLKILSQIKPAIELAKQENPDFEIDDLVDASAKINAKMTAEDLIKNSMLIQEKIASGDLQVMAAYYSLDSGRVEWL